MTAPVKACGDCEHYAKNEEHNRHGGTPFSFCYAPLPVWAFKLVKQTVFENEGRFCPVFVKRTSDQSSLPEPAAA